MKALEIPKRGLEELTENFSADSLSGFLVFPLPVVLSLEIINASGFPAAMGVLIATVGGVVICFFMGGRRTIMGPAAGLFTSNAAQSEKYCQIKTNMSTRSVNNQNRPYGDPADVNSGKWSSPVGLPYQVAF